MIWLTYAIISGILLAIFMSLMVFRSHDEIRWINTSKACVICEMPRGFLDFLPILGDLRMNGRCRRCSSYVTWQYPLIEISVILLVVFHFWRYVYGVFIPDIGSDLVWVWLLRDILFTMFLMIIFVYDLKYLIVIRGYALVSVLVAFGLNVYLGYDVLELLLGIFVLFLFFYSQYALSSGRILGRGDILIGLVLGSMFGLIPGVFAVMFGYIIGGIFGVAKLLITSGKSGLFVPFGPFLAIGGFVILIWGKYFLSFI